jgi:hypothetical protein
MKGAYLRLTRSSTHGSWMLRRPNATKKHLLQGKNLGVRTDGQTDGQITRSCATNPRGMASQVPVSAKGPERTIVVTECVWNAGTGSPEQGIVPKW